MPVKKYSGKGRTYEEALENAVRAALADQGGPIEFVQKKVLGDAGGFRGFPIVEVSITAQGINVSQQRILYSGFQVALVQQAAPHVTAESL